MFDSWRYGGRHRGRRGCFPDYYRSAEAFAAAQQITVELVELLDRDTAGHIELVHANHLRMFLPIGPPEPQPVWPVLPTVGYPLDTQPMDCSGWGDGGLLDYLTDTMALSLSLWLPGDVVDDDDDVARMERLMGMAGA